MELKHINLKKYFAVNSKYIKKLKELFKYDELKRLINIPNIDINIIKKEINNIIKDNEQIFDIDKNIIKNELEKNIYNHLRKEILNELNIFYFIEFEIISENLKECLIDYNLLPKNLELEEIKYKINEDKIIISPILQNKFFTFICIKNDDKEYITEKLYDFNTKKHLDYFIEGKIEPKIILKDKKCEILDDKNNKLGNAYEIIKLENNEIMLNIEEIDENNEGVKEEINREENKNEDILNMIRIYLYTKDLFNKIELSTKIAEDKSNFKEYIFSDKCFLINKYYMDSYKKQYSYNELEDELNEYIKINKSIIKKDPKGNIYFQENIDIIYKFLENNKNLDNYKKTKGNAFNADFTKLNEKKLTDKISYNDDFIIVKEEIYQYFFFNNNNSKHYIIN